MEESRIMGCVYALYVVVFFNFCWYLDKSEVSLPSILENGLFRIFILGATLVFINLGESTIKQKWHEILKNNFNYDIYVPFYDKTITGIFYILLVTWISISMGILGDASNIPTLTKVLLYVVPSSVYYYKMKQQLIVDKLESVNTSNNNTKKELDKSDLQRYAKLRKPIQPYFGGNKVEIRKSEKSKALWSDSIRIFKESLNNQFETQVINGLRFFENRPPRKIEFPFTELEKAFAILLIDEHGNYLKNKTDYSLANMFQSTVNYDLVIDSASGLIRHIDKDPNYIELDNINEYKNALKKLVSGWDNEVQEGEVYIQKFISDTNEVAVGELFKIEWDIDDFMDSAIIDGIIDIDIDDFPCGSVECIIDDEYYSQNIRFDLTVSELNKGAVEKASFILKLNR